MKKCFKCLKNKPLDKFYRHTRMKDGHLGKCITCTKKDGLRRYNNPIFRERIKLYEKMRCKTIERKIKVSEYQRKRRDKFKGKYKAHNKVSNAIRDNRLKRMPCLVCGDPKSQAHHTDYRKYLDVKWLCFKHHRQEHKQNVF